MPIDSRPLPHTVAIPSDLTAARDIEDQILKKTESLGYSPECAFAIRLALEEAMVNAHKHGNRGDRNKKIVVSYDVTPQRVVIRIRDEGRGFEPRLVPDPTAPDRISLPDGRGIMLMHAYLDAVNFSTQGNEVELVKERS